MFVSISLFIFVELENFLFENDEDVIPSLSVYQKLNPEAKELLLDMQEYSNIIGFYNSKNGTENAIKSRLQNEGLRFARMIASISKNYKDIKKMATSYYRDIYSISCYIDETEESPWHQIKNLHRLKF